MADVRPRVFISAVSGEFKAARNAVGADLRARGCEVTIQSDFRQGPDNVTLLKTLHDHIRDCHAVVCLIGKRAGASPPKAAVERFKEMLPAGLAEPSYTQWEYVFARHFNRRVYLYLANDDWAPDQAGDADDGQTTFVQFLKDQGDHWASFSTIDQLGRAALREEFSAKPVTSPPPSTKPIVLPYPSLGPLFKGREGFMQQLHESLSRGGQTAITSKALYGLGGIGKTRAAVEYAWAHRDEYTALLFVVAETPEALRRNLAALAGMLLPELDTTDEPARMRAVLDWLADNPGWFLILDNLDTREALTEADAMLTKLSGGHVVITSRLADFSANFDPVALDVLTIDDATAFLLDRTRGRRRNAKDDEVKAREIASELDGLALALEQAGAYIAKHRLNLDSYLERWRSAQHNDIVKWFDETVTGYKKAVAVTWQTSVEQLTEPGRRLLERLAWFAPEKVPEFILDVPVPGAEMENPHEALADLAAYSLVARDADGPFFLVHRLVQDVTQRSLAGEQQQTRLREALGWVDAAFPENSSDVRSWPRAEFLEPHAGAVVASADNNGIIGPTPRLMNHLGGLLYSKALYAEAEPLYQRSLAIREKEFGKDHLDVGVSLNNLAELYRVQGRYAEAEPLYRRSVAIREKALGKDHLAVGGSLNNLAILYQSQGRYAEAEPLCQRSLAITEKALGKDHPDVGAAVNNLADLYQSQGRYAEAEPLCQRSLAITEKALGNDHPDVGTALNNLAELYCAQGRHAEAEPLYQRDLAISEKALGKDHPLVGISLNNLAGLYQRQGRYAEAGPLYQRSLAINEKALGRDHPLVGTALNNLGELYRVQGRLAEAEPLHQRSHAIREKALGSDHPDVGVSLNNIALLYEMQGRRADVAPLYQRAIDIFTIMSRQVGRPHPNLAPTVKNYMTFLTRTGKTETEIEAERERLMRWEE